MKKKHEKDRATDTIRVTKRVKRKLRMRAVKEDFTMSEMIDFLLA